MADTNLETKVAVLEARMEVIEEKVDGRVTSEWVKDFAQPMQATVTGIENAVRRLTEKVESVFLTHNTMLLKEEARKEKEYESRTISGQIKKWGATAGAIGAIWFAFRVAGTFFEAWLSSKGYKVLP